MEGNSRDQIELNGLPPKSKETHHITKLITSESRQIELPRTLQYEIVARFIPNQVSG